MVTNNSVFNTENKPLYTFINNPYSSSASIAPPEADASSNGRLFMVTTANAAIAGGSNQLVQITNPNLSGRSLYVSRISGGTTAAATLILYAGGTVTGGTTPAPFNCQFGNTTTSIATARTSAGTVTGTPTQFMSLPMAAGMFNLDFTGGIIVPPNRSITLSLGPGAITAATNIAWWEV
ncbi:hypothetical protein AB4Z29_10910 [Paenibacillus sp. 2TAB23]|uniref:hypothetical protein n=1 Tax=Paenibacillus sp. 2TAB23 TaxID=3233004 RepID=UPI003F948885